MGWAEPPSTVFQRKSCAAHGSSLPNTCSCDKGRPRPEGAARADHNGAMALLSDDEVTTGLNGLPGWERAGDEIVKTYQLPTSRMRSRS